MVKKTTMYAKCVLLKPSCEHNNASDVTLEWCETSVKCILCQGQVTRIVAWERNPGVTYTITDEVLHSVFHRKNNEIEDLSLCTKIGLFSVRIKQPPRNATTRNGGSRWRSSNEIKVSRALPMVTRTIIWISCGFGPHILSLVVLGGVLEIDVNGFHWNLLATWSNLGTWTTSPHEAIVSGVEMIFWATAETSCKLNDRTPWMNSVKGFRLP